jgi:selenide,water dikinase
VLSTALKNDDLDGDGLERLVDLMTRLNDVASKKMLEFSATACTDITGFGLAGHALELANASKVTIEIDAGKVPLMEGAREAVKKGHLTGGGNQNRVYVEKTSRLDPAIDGDLQTLLFDPQTSGGLLIAVPPGSAAALHDSIAGACPGTAVIGSCIPRQDVSLILS